MMAARVDVVAASRAPNGARMVTLRMVRQTITDKHFLKHRMFSDSSASSRAIPVARRLATDIYIPEEWKSNQPGMQPSAPLPPPVSAQATAVWVEAAESARAYAAKLAELGVHKQWAGRLMEWCGWTVSTVTATDWRNFYRLRNHPDAQDETRLMAVMIEEAVEGANYVDLEPGQWHLPFADDQPTQETAEELLNEGEFTERLPLKHNFPGLTGSAAYLHLLLMISAARCARSSYLSHATQKTSTIAEDIELCRKLWSNPLHATPFEHQGTPDFFDTRILDGSGYRNQHWHGNLRGFVQLRKLLRDEYTPG